ncbi:GIY-YIG nuclease family protein [Pullulanibacillus pueri]|uniref:GIY-YIG nuclease family protein n=1 Tax=Pullulanibacillus pueri TaxID=1437324 RepID=UPI001662D113|nr:GIY-YIG nuclease family protein [Pullulanibacillus pueri]
MDHNHFVYILECADGTYYTGYTNNLEKRLRAHEQGKGAKYTRGRGPLKLIYHETFMTKEAAMSREYAIKRMNRQAKVQLVKGETMND